MATLLRLPYDSEGTKIKLASLEQTKSDSEKYTEMAQELWQLFARTYHGDIPPGLIFLRGDKLNAQGFGWAPRSFMRPHEVDYPDPFVRGAKTELHSTLGLLVRYPGVILHCTANGELRNSILGGVKLPGQETSQTFRFPVNRFQGYAMEHTEDEPFTKGLERILSLRSQLAIIMTRPHPQERPKEIGLLVEIYKKVNLEKEGGKESEVEEAFCCQIIRRVRVWYDSAHARFSANDPVSGDFEMGAHNLAGSECVGEVVGKDQPWYVDGVVPGREDDLPAFRQGTHVPVPGTRDRVFSRRYQRSAIVEDVTVPSHPGTGGNTQQATPGQGISRSKTLRTVGGSIKRAMTENIKWGKGPK